MNCVTDLILAYTASLALFAYTLNVFVVLCVGLDVLFSVLARCARVYLFISLKASRQVLSFSV